jgi:hypothetical protein
VCKQKNELFQNWVLMKQDAHDQLSEDELKDKTKEASGYAKIVLDTFKSFAKDGHGGGARPLPSGAWG